MVAVDYTLVLGVDRRHLWQLSYTIQSWYYHKPSLWKRPWCVFFDHEEVTDQEVLDVLDRRDENVLLVPWPPPTVTYAGDPEGPKWQRPQRHKMLAGFLHVPAMAVHTPYWLKLDTDVVARKGPDDWIQEDWFDGTPAIISQKWGYTKPADQMLQLDAWVKDHKESLSVLAHYASLDLQPAPESERLGHRRIISWCGFFDTIITRFAADCADRTVGRYQMPVPSQDGYAWYIAERLRLPIRRVNMRALGWEQWSSDGNIKNAVQEVLNHGH